MKLINRFSINDDIGVVIDDDGVTYNSLVKGLYDRDTLSSLLASGYKVYDYNGTIISPDGKSIFDLEEISLALPEYEIQMMYDACEYIMSEAEASQYFIREVKEAVHFMKPVEIVIHDRDELIKYINDNYYYQNSHDIRDVRPLNAITAPEALFDISELMADRDLCNKFTVMLKNRMMLNINEFDNLMDFFTEVSGGSMDFHNLSNPRADILNAYMAWGLSGIKTPVTDVSAIKIERNNIYSDDESDISISEIALVDKNGTIYYSGGSVTDIVSVDFEELPITVDMGVYSRIMNNVSEWKSECMPIRCFVRVFEPRMQLTFVDSSGVTMTAKVSHNATVVRDMHGVIYTHPMFSITDAYGTSVSLDYIHDRTSYAIFNTVKAQAISLLRGKVVKHKYKSSYEMCIGEGLSPEGALKYITSRITTGYGINSDIGSPNDMLGVDETFRHIKEEYITKYNPMQLDYDNVFELIDIMHQAFDDMQDDDNSTMSTVELRERPVERLCIARSILNSDLVIDDARLGRSDDVGISTITAMSLLYSIIRHEFAKPSYDDVLLFFQSTRLSEIIDIDNVFGIKDAEYKGMETDIARLRNDMASQASQLIYVTRVYREMSNDIPSNQRHYMFECVEFDASSKSAGTLLDRLNNAVISAIDGCIYLSKDTKDLLTMQSMYIAVTILFKIVLNSRTGMDIEIPVGNQSITVSVPESVYNSLHYVKEFISVKFSTLFDFCSYDVAQNGSVCMMCVNANITPWYVIPKHGYDIPEYNFTLNYVLDGALSGFSDAYRSKVLSSKAKVRQLCNQFAGNSLYKYDLSTFIGVNYTVDTIDTVLNNINDELPKDYYDRFMLHNKYAKANGQYLKTMRLKSDVTFANYQTVCASLYVEDDVYADLSDGNSSAILSYIDVVAIHEREKLSDTTSYRNNIKRFELEEEDLYDVLRWSDLLTGDITFNAFVVYGGSELLFIDINGQYRYKISELNVSKCCELATKGFMYQLSSNRFLLCTGFEYISLEVW